MSILLVDAPRTAAPASRRRRPSGEAPPLPNNLGRSGRHWIWVGCGVLATWFAVVMLGAGAPVDKADHFLLERLASLRTRSATTLARHLEVLGSPALVFVGRWAVIGVALAFRRFRHLVAFLGCVLFTTWVASQLAVAFARPRPDTVEILGTWSGYSHPSRPLADMAVVLIGFIYVVLPRGRFRGWAKAAAGTVLGLMVASRLYLGVEYPVDAVFGLVLGVAVTLIVFRVFVPTDSFPVTYRRGKAAHLDVGGRRGEAILVALREQLGLDAVAVRQFGLDGSAGSTPLKITLADGTTLFGKLYARNHLRSDRRYKLFRTLVYGRLEDESTFSSVRRLVQYEDYLLRLMHCAGIPTAKPYGFIEITPEREYLLVTEFFDGATEIGDAEVTDQVVDEALGVVRKLWEAGLAHRDVKPANVLVRDGPAPCPSGGKVLLIDVAFAEVRPSPWREAVDLANMMLVLALGNRAEHVYRRALRFFTPEEIGEAFAATRGIALTSQLRYRLKSDGRDLVAQFRLLAPPTPPIRIQRWSLRRVALTASVVATAVLLFDLAVTTFQGASLL